MNRRFVYGGLAGVGAVVCVALALILMVSRPMAMPAQAIAPSVSKSGQLVSYLDSDGTPLCLSVTNSPIVAGDTVTVGACNTKAPFDASRQWNLWSDGTIRNSGMCLDVNSAAAGGSSSIVVSACSGQAEQIWRPGTDSKLSLNNLVNFQSHECLDVDSGLKSMPGSWVVDLQTCTRATGQIWGWQNGDQPLVKAGDGADANCHSSIVDGYCYYWVQAFQANNGRFDAAGASVDISQPNPAVATFGGGINHSVAELWVSSADRKQAIELGWYKDPHDTSPVLFATTWVNGKFTGYAGRTAAAAVRVGNGFQVGDRVTVGETGSYQVLFAGNQWQLWYNHVEIGYFPESIWTTQNAAFTEASSIQVYGEVATEPYVVTETEMGNGSLGNAAGAARFSNYSLIASDVPAELTDFGQPQDSTLYSYGDTSPTGFSFGGPGAGLR